MATLPQVCTKCGAVSESPFFILAPGATVVADKDSVAISPCPYCGADANIAAGTYTAVVRRVIDAVRSPEVTRASLERLRDIAEGVRQGETTSAQANEQASALPQALAAVWKASGTTQTALLLQIIVVILMIYFAHEADEQTAKQNILAERQTQIQQKILEELKKKPPIPEAPKTKAASTPPTASRVSRQQRRAAEKPWKKKH